MILPMNRGGGMGTEQITERIVDLPVLESYRTARRQKDGEQREASQEELCASPVQSPVDVLSAKEEAVTPGSPSLFSVCLCP